MFTDDHLERVERFLRPRLNSNLRPDFAAKVLIEQGERRGDVIHYTFSGRYTITEHDLHCEFVIPFE
jgi:hypothetical protein